MITVGRLHQVSLTGAAVVAGLSIASGSTLLLTSGLLLGIALLLEARNLRALPRSRARTRLVHAVTLAGLVYAVATFRTSQIDSVLLVASLGIFDRFLLRGGHRDDYLVVGASAVLISAATTITPGVVFLVLVGFYLPLVLWALWSAQILGTAEDVEREPERKRAAVAAMAGRPVGRGLAFVGVAGFAFTVAVFLVLMLLPRYQFSQVLGAGYFMRLPGPGDAMELHTNGAPSVDEASVVLRVEPAPALGPGGLGGLYARLFVLDEFDGKRFRSSAANALYPVRPRPDRQSKVKPLDDDELPDLGPTDAPGTVRVTLNRLTRDRIHPIAALGRRQPGEIARRALRQTVSGTWTFGALTAPQLVYKVHLERPQPVSALPAAFQAAHDQRLLDLPPDLDPRVRELGARLAEGRATTAEKVSAVLRYLSTGFKYSLEPLRGDSPDPLARFLFEAKEGHCELFAAAVAVLLRVGGVRTRVATGYYGGRWNALGGYLAFTQGDAHAWVEVLDEAEGWRWVDATPEDLRSIRHRSPLAFLGDWYDAAEAAWFDHVVDFDERKRRLLVAGIEARASALEASVFGDGRQDADHQAERGFDPRRVGVLALFTVPGAAALFLAALRRRRAPAALGARLYRALGRRPGENVTLGVLVRRVPEPARPDARATVALYEALRFGPEGDAPSPATVAAAVEALERRLRRRTNGGRGSPPGRAA